MVRPAPGEDVRAQTHDDQPEDGGWGWDGGTCDTAFDWSAGPGPVDALPSPQMVDSDSASASADWSIALVPDDPQASVHDSLSPSDYGPEDDSPVRSPY